MSDLKDRHKDNTQTDRQPTKTNIDWQVNQVMLVQVSLKADKMTSLILSLILLSLVCICIVICKSS